MVGQLPQRVLELVEKALAAQVADYGEMASHARVDAHHAGQGQKQRGGQVVDDIVAQVLEGVHGLGAAGAAHAGDDHDVGDVLCLLQDSSSLVGPGTSMTRPDKVPGWFVTGSRAALLRPPLRLKAFEGALKRFQAQSQGEQSQVRGAAAPTSTLRGSTRQTASAGRPGRAG